jgi:hypothetical protein
VAGDISLPRRGRALILLAGVLALDAAVTLGIVWYLRASRRAAHEQRLAREQGVAVAWRENVAKPIVRPPTVKPSEATLQPDDFVIGVEVGGNARAYRLSAFDHPIGHLINDVVGDVPVSVAYCNLSRCVRVYTDPRASEPLDIEVAGTLDGEMVMKHNGSLYFQRSGEPIEPSQGQPAMPFALVNPALVKWKDWQREHPQTDVYVGAVGPLRKANMMRATP